MKKLITTALLFAELTMGAQSQLEERYIINDSLSETSIRYIAKLDGIFVDIDSRKDTLYVYPFISLYNSGFYIEAIWVGFANKFEKIKKTKFIFEKGSVDLRVCKSVDQSNFDKKYLMAPSKNTSPDIFNSSIYQLVINGKVYTPILQDDIYFLYMLYPFNELKSNWIK
jgi:hypothetical protein